MPFTQKLAILILLDSIGDLKPASKGKAAVAIGRGGPIHVCRFTIWCAMITASRYEVDTHQNLHSESFDFNLLVETKNNNFSTTRLTMKSMAMALQNSCLSWVWQASVGAFQGYAACLI